MTAFLLVPGAMATGRHWEHVVAALRDAGHEGIAPDLPAGPRVRARGLRRCRRRRR